MKDFIFSRKRRYQKFLLIRRGLESVKYGVLSETDLT
jgi:hypothetical protein